MKPSWMAGHPHLRGVFAILTVAAVLAVGTFVDFAPAVDENFFFASDDPAFQMDERLARTFPPRPQIIVSASGNLRSSSYYRDVTRLTRAIDDLEGVTRIQSVTRGPKNVSAAFEGPFWRRLLVGEDGRTTLLVVILSEKMSESGDARERLITQIDEVVARFQKPEFSVSVSGVPYVVEMIRRHLSEDMTAFTSAAVVIFSVILFMIFRSATILAGMLTACFFACAVTLGILHAYNIPIGILTANLLTIVFIMTLQHTVYLGYNIRHAGEMEVAAAPPVEPARGPAPDEILAPRERVWRTIAMTVGASWWGMVTTFAGFASLLLVDARPLRELGVAGGIGAAVAFVSAYLIFPSFLQTLRMPAAASARPSAEQPAPVRRGMRFLSAARFVTVPAVLVAALCIAPNARNIDTDPSLLSYFSEESEIRKGLDQVDRNGGSSPLLFVARDANGMRLDRDSAYLKLWSLQRALERHPSVGTVLSLPLIMSEAKRAPFGFFFNYRFLLEQGEKPQYGRVTNAFVTQDRQRAFFLLRMKENVQRDHRLEEIEEIRSIFRRNGFRLESMGGLYFLQGKLSQLIHDSLLTGVAQLLGFFLIVGALVSRRIRWTLALVVTLAVGPALVLGGIGLMNVPVDIVSAPAVNIAVAMGIADMIQLTTMARKLRKRGLSSRDAWTRSVRMLWKPAAVTSVAVSAGFAIFLLSNFPPTQRFGVAVVSGTIIALFGSLVILPTLCAAGWRSRARS